MTMNGHCLDNERDREIGAHWERQFCVMAADHGKMFTPHQLPLAYKSAAAYNRAPDGSWNQCLLPDVTVWSAPGEHHEIKHKNLTYDGCYGLEAYRLRPLVDFANETGQAVLYTIHDWQQAGAAHSEQEVLNRLEDWFYANVLDLNGRFTATRSGPSWVRGKQQIVPIHYWTARRHFRPLSSLWHSAALAH